MAKNHGSPFRIYKRGNTWHAYFSVVIQGRRILVRESTGHSDQEQAQQYCIKRLQEITSSPDTTGEITLDEAAARWLVEVVQYQSSNQSTIIRLDKLLKEMDIYTPLSKITKAQINRFIDGCRAAGRKPATINRYLNVLSALFTRARDYWDCKTPGFKMSQFKQDEPVENIKYFRDMDEIQKIVDNAAPHLKPIILTGIYTGLRLGRILDLQWDQVDLDHNQIVFIGKNKTNQSVPVVPALREILENLPRDSDFVFTYQGKPIQRITKAWTTALARAKVPYRSFHTLRHTTATWLLRDSKDLRLVKDVLGHKTMNTTLKYAHLADDRKAQGLGNLFNQKAAS